MPMASRCAPSLGGGALTDAQGWPARSVNRRTLAEGAGGRGLGRVRLAARHGSSASPRRSTRPQRVVPLEAEVLADEKQRAGAGTLPGLGAIIVE
jgi:hypothetical protein